MMKTVNKEDKVQMLQFGSLSDDCNISHFITTRHGGAGEGNYASFNLGAFCGDDPEIVLENRKRFCTHLGIEVSDLYVPFQAHGTELGIIDETFLSATEEQRYSTLHGVDALVTNVPGICIAVTTADCVPLLFYSPDKKVIGVVHAGWKGTLASISAKTIRRMVSLYSVHPEELCAGIAPSIGKGAFEVGDEVVQAFRDSDADLPSICSYNPSTGKAHIDLAEANRLQLVHEGVLDRNIEMSGICTYTMHNDFFSARRLGIRSGRILTGIMINKNT